VDAHNVETDERGSNDPNVALKDGDIVADYGLRIPIENLHPNIRNAVRKAYIFEGSI
jgi:hypothetical protein